MSDRPRLFDGLRRNWLETAFGLLLVAVIVLLLVRDALPKGVVALRPIDAGADLTSADLALVPMLATPEFDTLDAVKGLMARRDIAPGEPIRAASVGSAYAVTARGIAAGAVLQRSDATLEPADYVESAFRDLSFAGRPALTAIPKGSVLRASMVGPVDPSPLRAKRAIEPFRFLTSEDVNRQPTARTCAVVPVAAGAVLEPSMLATIDSRFDRIMTVSLASGPPRTAAGAHATLNDKPVQILSAADGKAVIALAAADVPAIAAAAELRAVQELTEVKR